MRSSEFRTLILAVGVALASCAPALAMQPAEAKPGYQAGGEIGLNFNNGSTIAGAADLNYGLKTNLLQSTYTAGVIDFLSTGRKVGGDTLRFNLLTVGIRQPLPLAGSTPISIEGGLSHLDVSGAGSTSKTSGFVGGRATLSQGSSVSVIGMGRYHFEGNGFWQAGGGIVGPLGHSSGLTYQVDYYHTGGQAGINTDTLLFGIRISGGV
jgi:hypothetical protein